MSHTLISHPLIALNTPIEIHQSVKLLCKVDAFLPGLTGGTFTRDQTILKLCRFVSTSAHVDVSHAHLQAEMSQVSQPNQGSQACI